MKLVYQLFGILLLWVVAHNMVLAQGLSCQTATPMCDDITPYPVNFTGTGPGTGPQAPAGPNYDCLLTTPNPTYFTITITQTGTIQFDIENTNVEDIDFILWGPFANLFAATAACSSLGNGGAGGSVIDCSYDPQAFESVDITNAVAGQVYIMMITNYANVATSVFSTPNTGTGALGCPCQLDANFSIVPLANGTGTMTSSSTSAAEFKVCPGDTLYFNVGIGADNIADTLSIFASLTTIANTFSASQYEIFGPFYPNAPFQDTMDFIVMITPGATQTGIFSFSLGVENTGTSNCFDSYPITVVVPGIPNLPPGDTICSGGTYDLVAGSFPATASGTNSYTWTQISGPVATITNGTSSTATISPPVIPSGDSMRFQLVYNYGGCVFRDTIKIYGYDIDINISAAPNPVCAGQPVNLNAVLTDSVGLVVTTTCAPTYTSALTAFAPIAAAGTTVTLGDDQVSAALPIGFSFQYYCNTYTQFYIGSNGFITFTAGASATVYNQTLPSAAQPNNLIALCWTDLDPSSGGTIRYQTTGVAPNRQLIVTYSNVPTYSGGDLCTVQAVLKEGTNVIDLHITYAIDDIDPFFGLSNQPLTIGMENATGTSAIIGVNSITNSFVQNQSLRITPNITTTTTSSPISYAWTPTATLNNSTIRNPIATPTAPTTYVVTIQNGACVFTDSIQVNISGSLPAPVVTCGTSTYTSITFNWSALALPGGGFYQFSINGGTTWTNVGTALTTTLTGLSPGTTITILVRGNNGLGTACSPGVPGTVTCTTLPCILTLTDVKEHVICFGEATGEIDLTPNNGVPPYNYAWGTGATTQDLVSLAAGTYDITVSDAVGCTATSSITVTQPAKGLGLTSYVVNPLCNGANNGCAVVNVAYGTGNYSYNWSSIGMATDSICGLAAGTYTLTVTDTVMAGSAGGLVTLYSQAFDGVTHDWTLNIATGANGTEPNFWTVNNFEAGQPVGTCGAGGGFNKSLHVTSDFNPNGGAAYDAGGLCGSPFFFACPETNKRAESPIISTVGQSNLTLKFNYISVGDGLLDNASVVYSVNGGGTWLVLNPSIKSLNNCPGSQGRWAAFTAALPATCNNNPNVKVGINWTNNDDAVGSDPSVAIDSVVVFTNSAGAGAKYCYAYDTVTLTQPTPVAIAVNGTTNTSCNGGNNGAATVSATGGSGTHSYLWSNAATTATITGLVANIYTVTVTDTNSCAMTQTVTITQPSALVAAVDSTLSPTCNGTADGAIYIQANGGTIGYTYNWTGGVTTQDLTAIPSGNYNVTITDANGCTTTLSQTITQPGAVSVAISALSNITCNGGNNGTATAAGTSGIPGYNFVWTGGQTTATATGLALGTYIVTISDQNGCTDTASVVITEPSIVTASVPTSTAVTCAGGSNATATAAGAGGTGTHTFVWSAGGQTNATATGLTAGIYTVTATDANGCAATSSVTITEPSAVVAGFASSFPANCAGASDGEATATGTGGTGSGYTFVWSAGGQVTATATGLAAGTHIVTVTDANGCTATNSIVITEPNSVTASVPSNTTVTCAGGSNGTATAAGTGGTGSGYTFVWSAGGQVTAMATGLAAGSYNVTVIDANGCEGVATTVITEATPVSATNTVSNITCGNVDNGSITVAASGGTGSYTYIWNGAASGQGATASTLPAGSYNVTITDGNGCTTTNNATVSPSVPLDSATVPMTVVTGVLDCQLNPVGALSIIPVSGTGYTYIWSNGATDATANGLAANTYNVTITNGSGCTMTQTGTVVAPFVPNVNPFVSVTGSSSITVTTDDMVDIDGGNNQSGLGVSYVWTASSTDITIGNNSNHTTTAISGTAGTYTLTITATSGTAPNCTDAGIVTITYESSFVGMPNAFTPGNGDNINDVFAPIGLNSTEVEIFKVFNRWGQLLYDGSDLQGGGWDGTYLNAAQPSEVYMYLLQYKLGSAESVIIRGEVILVR